MRTGFVGTRGYNGRAEGSLLVGESMQGWYVLELAYFLKREVRTLYSNVFEDIDLSPSVSVNYGESIFFNCS